MTTAKEMNALSVDELKHLASETRDLIFRQRIKHRTGTLESTAEMLKSRREMARILTISSEKLGMTNGKHLSREKRKKNAMKDRNALALRK